MSGKEFVTNEEAVAYMRRVAVEGSGFSNFLNLEPLKCFQGEAEVLLALRPEMTQHHGFAHGAIIGVLADTSCAWAAASVIGDVVTGSYMINFLSPAKGTHLRARAKVVKAGKRQAVVRTEIWSESEGADAVLCAVATATIMPVG